MVCHSAIIIGLDPSSTVRFLISLLPHLFVLGLNTSILPIKHLRQLLVHVLLDKYDEVLAGDRQDDQGLSDHHNESKHVRKVEVSHPRPVELEGIRDLQELVIDLDDEVCFYAVAAGRI